MLAFYRFAKLARIQLIYMTYLTLRIAVTSIQIAL